MKTKKSMGEKCRRKEGSMKHCSSTCRGKKESFWAKIYRWILGEPKSFYFMRKKTASNKSLARKKNTLVKKSSEKMAISRGKKTKSRSSSKSNKKMAA